MTDAGLPGLALFCIPVWVWLRTLGRGLFQRPAPVRVGLFIAAVLQLWPLASTAAVQSVPIGAWLFLLLGYGVAHSGATAVSARQTAGPWTPR